jgi:enoyl-CoA hydratase/carnithine racemase
MIRLEIAGRIATVTLSRPPVNAISTEWIAHFDSTLEQLAARSDWHILHIRSDQKVFCAGADLAQVRACLAGPDGPDQMLAFVAGMQRLFARIEELPQVTLAEIGGAALGGGLELALACDLRIAAAEAKLGLPEARLGVIPGAGGTQRLTRLCGQATAARLILGAEVIDGGTATTLGIAHWSVPRAELPGRSAEITRRIAELPAAALAASKACIAAAAEPGRGGYLDELEHTRRLYSNEDTRRRVEAFLADNVKSQA